MSLFSKQYYSSIYLTDRVILQVHTLLSIRQEDRSADLFQITDPKKNPNIMLHSFYIVGSDKI